MFVFEDVFFKQTFKHFFFENNYITLKQDFFNLTQNINITNENWFLIENFMFKKENTLNNYFSIILLALFCLIAVLGFKITAAPFHR
jgi:hypothetical protein